MTHVQDLGQDVIGFSFVIHGQVTKLLKQVKELGGPLERERAVSPPPMPDISENAFLQGTSDQGKRLSELELENAALKQRISQ